MPEIRPSFLTGLIGAGIGASLSPRLHEREAELNGLRLVYQLIDISSLGLEVTQTPALLTAARRVGFTGLNITHPAKQAVLEHLDELPADAAVIGAVNTVIFGAGRSAGRITGHNTDWLGFARSLERGLPDAAKRKVVVLGAGGAGSAVAYAILRLGAAQVTVIDTDRRRTDALVRRMGSHFGGARIGGADHDLLEPSLAAADGLIHATPVGMASHPGLPFPPRFLRPGQWVADVVYSPLETELLHHARIMGCPTLAGGAMLAFQAAEAFRLFTGVRPDTDRMLRHVEALTNRVPGYDRVGAH